MKKTFTTLALAATWAAIGAPAAQAVDIDPLTAVTGITSGDRSLTPGAPSVEGLLTEVMGSKLVPPVAKH